MRPKAAHLADNRKPSGTRAGSHQGEAGRKERLSRSTSADKTDHDVQVTISAVYGTLDLHDCASSGQTDWLGFRTRATMARTPFTVYVVRDAEDFRERGRYGLLFEKRLPSSPPQREYFYLRDGLAPERLRKTIPQHCHMVMPDTWTRTFFDVLARTAEAVSEGENSQQLEWRNIYHRINKKSKKPYAIHQYNRDMSIFFGNKAKSGNGVTPCPSLLNEMIGGYDGFKLFILQKRYSHGYFVVKAEAIRLAWPSELVPEAENVYLKSADELLAGGEADEPQWFRDSGPTRADFDGETVVIRDEVETLRQQVADHRLSSLLSPATTGKSVLVRTLAYDALRGGRALHYFSFATDLSYTVKELYQEIRLASGLVVLDDIHLCLADAEFLYSQLASEEDENDTRILFVGINHQPQTTMHGIPPKAGIHNLPGMSLQRTSRISHAIIREYAQRHNMGDSLQRREIDILNFSEDNLWLLAIMIEGWDQAEGEGDLLDWAANGVQTRLQEHSFSERRIIVAISASYMKEIPMSEEYLLSDLALSDSGLANLVHRSHVLRTCDSRGRAFCALPHSSLARAYWEHGVEYRPNASLEDTLLAYANSGQPGGLIAVVESSVARGAIERLRSSGNLLRAIEAEDNDIIVTSVLFHMSPNTADSNILRALVQNAVRSGQGKAVTALLCFARDPAEAQEVFDLMKAEGLPELLALTDDYYEIINILNNIHWFFARELTACLPLRGFVEKIPRDSPDDILYALASLCRLWLPSARGAFQLLGPNFVVRCVRRSNRPDNVVKELTTLDRLDHELAMETARPMMPFLLKELLHGAKDDCNCRTQLVTLGNMDPEITCVFLEDQSITDLLRPLLGQGEVSYILSYLQFLRRFAPHVESRVCREVDINSWWNNIMRCALDTSPPLRTMIDINARAPLLGARITEVVSIETLEDMFRKRLGRESHWNVLKTFLGVVEMFPDMRRMIPELLQWPIVLRAMRHELTRDKLLRCMDALDPESARRACEELDVNKLLIDFQDTTRLLGQGDFLLALADIHPAKATALWGQLDRQRIVEVIEESPADHLPMSESFIRYCYQMSERPLPRAIDFGRVVEQLRQGSTMRNYEWTAQATCIAQGLVELDPALAATWLEKVGLDSILSWVMAGGRRDVMVGRLGRLRQVSKRVALATHRRMSPPPRLGPPVASTLEGS